MSVLLTKNGHDDDAEIEDVPRLFEVVESQAEQLHDALEREDGDEELVDEADDHEQLVDGELVDETEDDEELVDEELVDGELVDEVEDDGQLLRFVVMFHRHRRHVEQDDDHDHDVEVLVRRQLEEELLALELYQEQQQGNRR